MRCVVVWYAFQDLSLSQIRRIPVEDLELIEEITRVHRNEYILSAARGEMIDRCGARRRVMVRTFKASGEKRDKALAAFMQEIELRRDFL